MADVQPLHTLRYEPAAVGSLEAVIAPPYDVIDAPMRADLLGKSPFNVVEIDLPQSNGSDPYLHAADVMEAWRQQGILVREREPAVWALEQTYTAPGGASQTRRGFFCRVRVEDYGPGRIRPHERTHPGPKEDRLRLTRATRANLSPIFSLFADPENAAGEVLEAAGRTAPFADASEADGTRNRLWRISDPEAISVLQSALGTAELLIADGHHRYETARVYADEVGGEGEHNYVLMFLCSTSDPGLLVFPTHRLLTGLKDDTAKQQAIREVLTENFDVEQSDWETLDALPRDGVVLGYADSHHKQPYRLTLKRPVDMPGKPAAYTRLDTAVLETLVLRGALGMTEDDIDHKRGLDYSKDFADARDAVETGRADAVFFMRGTPVEQVREVAEAGESMPPKSTYFYPKVPTGLVFNLLE